MKYFTLVVFIIAFNAFFIVADELQDFEKTQEKVSAAKKKLNAKKNKNSELKRSIATLKNTAQLTLDPAFRPTSKVNKREKLFFSPLDSTNKFYGIKGSFFEVVDMDGLKAIKIQSPKGAESIVRKFKIPEGSIIHISVQMKGVNIKKVKPEHFRGTKLGITMSDGEKDLSPGAPAFTGTFNWREVFFETKIPLGCKFIRLYIGLSGAEGTVYLRNLLIEKL
jgi:cell division protein FtsB